MKKKPQSFRVLFVYPNIQMRTIAPMGIALMSAILKKHDYSCDVFDATRYASVYTNPEEDYDSSHEKFVRMNTHNDRIKNSGVLSFDWKERSIELKYSNVWDDYQKKIEEYDPDLIAISIVENTYDLALEFAQKAPKNIPIVCGGVFCTYAPEIVIREPSVDYVVRGEGEYALLDLVTALANDKSTHAIANIWSKEDNNIIRNGFRRVLDINDLPVPDFSIFEEPLLYAPMQGRIWKAIGFETQRGCPYLCTFCNSPTNNTSYRGENAGNFYRKKKVDVLKRELEVLIKRHNPELIYFVVDTFLAMSSRELDEFSEFYQSYKIPFWMNTRAETVNEHSAKHLSLMNCLRFNIGIEHGNEVFRAKVLKRPVSNKRIVDSFKIAAKYAEDYTCVANSIVGLPTETADLVFDTIKLNRQLPDEIVAAGAFVFMPFHGTSLRTLALKHKYISPDLICTESANTSAHSLMNMPQFSAKQIAGLIRAFSFYVKFPMDSWPNIDRSREFTAEGNKMFDVLKKEYENKYTSPQLKIDHKGARIVNPEPSAC